MTNLEKTLASEEEKILKRGDNGRSMKVKIIAYNILQGFHNGDHKHQPEREKAAQRIIKKEKPDVLVLTEANYLPGNQYSILQDYQKIFNYPYIATGTDNPLYSWGVAVLSKFPIILSENYSLKHKRFIRTKLDLGKETLNLDAVNPAPSQNTEYERAQWFKNIIRDRKAPYVLAGDFNALSPEDQYNKGKILPFFASHKSVEEAPDRVEKMVDEMLSCQTIKYLLDQGLIDTYRTKNKKHGYTHPTAFVKDAPLRIDYIFCSPDIKVIDAGIIKNAETDQASDHYPIYALLNI